MTAQIKPQQDAPSSIGRDSNETSYVSTQETEETNLPITTHWGTDEYPTETAQRSRKSHCFGCGRIIEDGNIMEVLNGIYHENCFKCQFCRRILNHTNYRVEYGLPYCETRCDITPQPMDKSVTVPASSAKHSSETGVSLNFVNLKDKSSHKEYCFACGRCIDSLDLVRAFDGIFHSDCFRCQECDKLLKIGSCRVAYGKLHCDPSCEESYQKSQLSENKEGEPVLPLDDRSEKTISIRKHRFSPTIGENVTAYTKYEDFTPNAVHLSQYTPMKPDKASCLSCGNPVSTWDSLEVDQKLYHKTCFRCRLCNRSLNVDKYQILDGGRCCFPNCSDGNRTAQTRTYIRPTSFSHPTSRNSYPVSFVPVETVSNQPSARRASTELHVYEGSQNDRAAQGKTLRLSASLGNEQLCPRCGKNVYLAEQLRVMNRCFHRSCFRCTACNRVLDIVRYSVHDGQPYCIPHHQHLTRNRSSSATNLRSSYQEEDYAEQANKTNSQTSYSNGEPDWVSQHITRSQTAPAIGWSDNIRQESVISSPIQFSKLSVTSNLSQDVLPVITSSAQSPSMGSKQDDMHTPVPLNEADIQFCYTCGRSVHPYHRIALTNKVYHPDCAKCYICQINLGMSNYRDFEGKLYCAPHYAQTIAEFIENRRKIVEMRSLSTKSTPATRPPSISRDPEPLVSVEYPSKIGFVSEKPTFVRPDRQKTNRSAWSVYDLKLDDTGPPSRSFRPASSENMSNMTNTIIVDTSQASNLNSQPPSSQLSSSRASVRQELISPKQYTTAFATPVIQDFERCQVCDKVVQPTTYMTLGGQPCHFGCLTCFECRRSLNQYNFKELEGKVYCCADYSRAIDKKLLPVNSVYKTEELKRTKSLPMGHSPGLRMHVDKTKCYACSRRVYATEALYVMERVYHKGCFKCQKCNGNLGVENYHVLNGMPYCRPHYRQLLYSADLDSERTPTNPQLSNGVQSESRMQGLLINHAATPPLAEVAICRTCQQPVQPRDAIHILQQYYHYDCFKCEHCGCLLNMGRFEMAQGKSYCPEDFLQLFGRKRGISSRQSLMHLNELVRSRSMERNRSPIIRNGHPTTFRQPA